jgi:error-prone DNA polymerase
MARFGQNAPHRADQDRSKHFLVGRAQPSHLKLHLPVLSAGMLAVQGRIQREGEVVHLVAQQLTDLSADFASVGDRDTSFPLPHGRGDHFHHGSPTPDPRGLPKGWRTPDIYIPDLHIDAIKVETRDFR